MSLNTNLQNLATRISTELKALRILINGNAADLSGLATTTKTNLVAAINELQAAVDAASQSGGASINDAGLSTSTTWSSTKIDSEIDSNVSAAITSLVNGAPTALDTLKELADALEAAATDSEVAAIVTALDNRVRYDAPQSLTGPQQAQARANIGAGTSDLVIGTTGTTAKAGNYQPTAANISDATATGRAVLTAADQVAARTAIGAGTSNLALGTTGSTAKAGDYQPTVENISNATTVGRNVLKAADAAAARTAIGAGTSDLVIGTTANTAKAGNYSPPTASDTQAGIVELATVTEATTGTDTARAVTPAGLKAVADTKASVTAVGDTETDLVAIFEAGLV